MRTLKKIVLAGLQGEKIEKSCLKFITGGYNLDEIVVECGQYEGQCWASKYYNECNNPYTYCCFTGSMSDSCYYGK